MPLVSAASLKVLIHTKVANYMEFKPVDGSFVYRYSDKKGAKVHKVPITHTLPLPGASCHVKDMPKLRDAFQIPSDPPSAAGARAHSPPPASPSLTS